MIDLRYNLSMLAYKLKDKLNRKKGHDEEDLDEPDFRTDFTSDEDMDQPLSDRDEETPEDGDLIIPDDEEDEGAQAKMLRRKHILLAAGSILFIGAGAMAYSSLNPTTASGGKESKKALSQNVAQAQDTDLPTKYSDISKYQKNTKAGKDGKTPATAAENGQTVLPSSGYGNGTSSPSASRSSGMSWVKDHWQIWPERCPRQSSHRRRFHPYHPARWVQCEPAEPERYRRDRDAGPG